MKYITKLVLRIPEYVRTKWTSSITKEPFYQLKEDVTFNFKGVEHTIPKDVFMTDLASIPWWLHWALPPDHDDIILAAIIHDFLTWCRFARESGTDHPYMHKHVNYSLWSVDRAMYEVMRMDGLGFIRSNLVWFGVWLNFNVLVPLGISPYTKN